jgi:hypothetical protein
MLSVGTTANSPLTRSVALCNILYTTSLIVVENQVGGMSAISITGTSLQIRNMKLKMLVLGCPNEQMF